MKALVKTQKGEGFVELKDCDVPGIKSDEVLIRVKYTGICGTDIHILHDRFQYWPPVKAIDVQFNMSSSYNGWVIALRMLASRSLNVDELITVMPLDEWKNAFDLLECGKAVKILLECK